MTEINLSAPTEIIRRSHGFVVRNPSRAIVPLIYKLANQYTQFQFVYDKDKRRNVWKPNKTYVIYVDGGREFRFHIGQFNEFMQLMQLSFVDPSSYTIEDEAMYEADPLDLELMGDKELYPEQAEAVDFILDGSKKGERSSLIAIPTGGGKEQPLYAKIKVPGGWKRMGEIEVGDTVITPRGTRSRVLGVYPQGRKQIYQLCFEDGRTAECGLSHLWRVYDQFGNGEVISLKAIKNRLRTKTLYIELPVPEAISDIPVPMDPYKLARLVSGECLYYRKITELNGRRYLTFFKNFQGIGNNNGRVDLVDGVQLIRDFRFALPDEYLHASVMQKTEFLLGLFDYDVTGREEPQTVSIGKIVDMPILVAQVLEIIRSLGGKATLGPAQITIHFPRNLSSVTSKLRLVHVDKYTVDEAACISIDDEDQLYVTDNYVVTHNTVTSLFAAKQLDKRLAICVLGGYTDKWLKDIAENMRIDPKEIAVIQGSDSLIKYSHYPNEERPLPKVLIISINTMSKWYKLYEEDQVNPRLEAYGCLPQNFFEHLKIGTVIYDEIHQHPHIVYEMFTFLHIPQAIALSATFISKDPVLAKVQSMMFPRYKRYDKIRMKRYITSHACAYQIMNFQYSGIQTTQRGKNSYSHIEFEKSLLSKRRHRLLEQYLRMLGDLVDVAYVENKADEDKLLLFVSSKKMAEVVVDYLKERFPQFDTRTYLQESDYADVIEPDIRVTTVLSAGTAVDIPNLRVTILTINIDSIVSNYQAFGRLRELKHRTENKDVHFYYLYCTSIAKHREYHQNKVEMLSDRVIDHKEHFLGTLFP